MSNMKSRFQLKLVCALILFAMLVSALLAISDHLRMRDQAIANTEKQIEFYETSIHRALNTLDKAYSLFGQNKMLDMKKISYELVDKYEANPDVDKWDFQKLKEIYQVDIYLINEENKIVYSSYLPDLGMDFDECCASLTEVLDMRRSDGGFFAEGIDMEQHSGELKKYSYIATKDKKYIIELGYSQYENEIYQKFNFIQTIEELVLGNSSINGIRILNNVSRSIGGTGESSGYGALKGTKRQAFDTALATGKTTEYREEHQGETVVYRYVRHESLYDMSLTRLKVLEIAYNEKELDRVLSVNTRTFIYQLFGVLVIAAGLSLLIAGWVARPMYLAFHDSLTGLMNRAAFEEDIRKTLAKTNGKPGLLLIDLDNFKIVNDRMGHDAGDRVLCGVARGIRAAIGVKAYAYRLGGDEFVALLPSVTPQEAEETASRVLSSVRRAISSEVKLLEQHITASIGIALAPEHGADSSTLCENADNALYRSKELGKNRFQLYSPSYDVSE